MLEEHYHCPAPPPTHTQMIGNRGSGESSSVDIATANSLLTSVKYQYLCLPFPAQIVFVGASRFLYQESHDLQRASICLPGAGGLIDVTVHCGQSLLVDTLTLISGLYIPLFSSSFFLCTPRAPVI